MRKGQNHTEVAKELLRQARSRQVHPALANRGITIEQVDAARIDGKRWCAGECRDFVDSSLFSATARRCRPCVAKKRARWRSKATPERLASEAVKTWAWRQENPEYERRHHLLEKYGVTPEWYEEQLEKQDGHCALCPATTAHLGLDTILFVDHCHATGAVRGILCAKCNTHLGIMEADQGWHDRALDYLTRKFPEVPQGDKVVPA